MTFEEYRAELNSGRRRVELRRRIRGRWCRLIDEKNLPKWMRTVGIWQKVTIKQLALPNLSPAGLYWMENEKHLTLSG